MTLTRADLEALDRGDKLAPFRDRFALPEGIVYLDGNSLGALPRETKRRVAETVEREWGEGLIRSWNAHRWIDLPLRVGDKIARLIGARPGEVAVADSTSINLFKLLSAARSMEPRRRVLLSESDNFPTDLYIAQGLAEATGTRLVLAEPGALEAELDALGDTLIAAFLTHVNYRTGRMHDLARVTRAVHERTGGFVVWDLAHSAGAVPVDLGAAGADFAVGCGYKYLNGGPGAPSFLYVAEERQKDFRSPLTGWFGHAAPFAFETSFRPATGIGRTLVGTPPILSLVALEVGVDLALAADLAEVRRKSAALGDLFIALVEQECAGHGLRLVSPRAAEERGSQVSFAHPEGYAVMQALIARGVIGDFRAPDILRFGFAPLYLRHSDLWDAVAQLKAVLAGREWDRPEYRRRQAVT